MKEKLYWSQNQNIKYKTAYYNQGLWLATVSPHGTYATRDDINYRPWPAGIETMGQMMAYIETLFRMGEL